MLWRPANFIPCVPVDAPLSVVITGGVPVYSAIAA
jgi:hypothetical protein